MQKKRVVKYLWSERCAQAELRQNIEGDKGNEKVRYNLHSFHSFIHFISFIHVIWYLTD